MEEAEVDKYSKALDKAAQAYTNFGTSLGVFVGLSNLAINGKFSLGYSIITRLFSRLEVIQSSLGFSIITRLFSYL